MLLVRNGTYAERSHPGSHPQHQTMALVLQQSYQRATSSIHLPNSVQNRVFRVFLLQKVLGRSGCKGLEKIWLQFPHYLEGGVVPF